MLKGDRRQADSCRKIQERKQGKASHGFLVFCINSGKLQI